MLLARAIQAGAIEQGLIDENGINLTAQEALYVDDKVEYAWIDEGPGYEHED